MGKRRKEKVAEAVAGQTAAGLETVLKQPAQQRFVFRECHHAVANVAGRQDLVLAAQASGAAPIVGNSNDGREIGNRSFARRQAHRTANDVFAQAAQQCRKPGATAQRGNPQAANRETFSSGPSFHIASFFRSFQSTCSAIWHWWPPQMERRRPSRTNGKARNQLLDR